MSNNRSLAEFKTRMKGLKEQCRQSAHETMLLTAQEIAGNMAAAAPKDEGNLANSVRVVDNTRVTAGSRTISVKIKGGGKLTMRRSQKSGQVYDYAAAIEFGNREHQAQPFFYPTWRRYRNWASRQVEESIEEALAENKKMLARRARPTFGSSRHEGVVSGKQRR